MPDFDKLVTDQTSASIIQNYTKLLHDLQNSTILTLSQQQLISDVSSLLQEIESRTALVGDNKNIQQALDPSTKEALLEKYLAVSNSLKICKEAINVESILQTFDKLQNAISTDVFCLNDYQPQNGLMSLNTLFENNMQVPIDISNQNLGSMGGSQSSRIPFKYNSPDGKVYNGFFTQSKQYNPYHDFINQLNDFEKANPNYSQEIALYKKVMDKLIKKTEELVPKTSIENGERPPKYSREELFTIGLKNSFGVKGRTNHDPLGALIINNNYFEHFLHSTGGLSKEEIHAINVQPQLKNFINKLTASTYNTSALHRTAGISPNNRIDSRNAALSAVASLLGKPNLIAKAVPMTITNNGQEIKGTFMATADGLDVNHRTEDDESYSKSDLNNSNGLGSIADLQVLDFICGNIDRHGGNLIYQFDEHDHFKGVVGIDNDLSFGEFVPTSTRNSVQQLVAPQNMKVMTKSMFDKIQALNPAQLEMVLSPFQLSKEQIDACKTRLDYLKTNLKHSSEAFEAAYQSDPERKKDSKFFINGWIKVVDDKEFAKFNVDDLVKEGRYSNLYHKASHLNPARHIEEKNLGKDISKAPTKVDAVSVNRYAKEAKQFITDMEQGTTWRGSSKEFEAVKDALRDYGKFHADRKNQMLSMVDSVRHDKMLQNIEKLIDAYDKRYENKTSKSDYAKDRKALMDNIRSQIKQQYIHPETLSPEQQQLMRQADERHVQRLNEQGKAMAMQSVMKAVVERDLRTLESIGKDPSQESKFFDALADHMDHRDIASKYCNKDGKIELKNFNEVINELKETPGKRDNIKDSIAYQNLKNTLNTPAKRDAFVKASLKKEGLKPTVNQPSATKKKSDPERAKTVSKGI